MQNYKYKYEKYAFLCIASIHTRQFHRFIPFLHHILPTDTTRATSDIVLARARRRSPRPSDILWHAISALTSTASGDEAPAVRCVGHSYQTQRRRISMSTCVIEHIFSVLVHHSLACQHPRVCTLMCVPTTFWWSCATTPITSCACAITHQRTPNSHACDEHCSLDQVLACGLTARQLYELQNREITASVRTQRHHHHHQHQHCATHRQIQTHTETQTETVTHGWQWLLRAHNPQDFEMLCILDEGVAKKTLDKATVDKFETGEVRLRVWESGRGRGWDCLCVCFCLSIYSNISNTELLGIHSRVPSPLPYRNPMLTFTHAPLRAGHGGRSTVWCVSMRSRHCSWPWMTHAI